MSQPSWVRARKQHITASEALARIRRSCLSFTVEHIEAVDDRDAVTEWCAELEGGTSLANFTYDGCKLEGDSKDWLVGWDEVEAQASVTVAESEEKCHPGNCLLSLASWAITRRVKDASWAVHHVTAHTPRKRIDLPSVYSKLTTRSYFRKHIKIAASAEINHSAEFFRGVWQTICKNGFQGACFAVIDVHDFLLPEVTLEEVVLEPLRPQKSPFMKASDPTGLVENPVHMSNAEQISCQTPRKTTLGTNHIYSTTPEISTWTEKPLEPGQHVKSTHLLPQEAFIPPFERMGDRADDAVQRLPWDLYMYALALFRSPDRQDLVRPAQALSLKMLSKSLPLLSFDGREGDTVSIASLLQLEKLISDDYINHCSQALVLEVGKAAIGRQSLLSAEYTTSDQSHEELVFETRSIPHELMIQPLWADSYSNKKWRKIQGEGTCSKRSKESGTAIEKTVSSLQCNTKSVDTIDVSDSESYHSFLDSTVSCAAVEVSCPSSNDNNVHSVVDIERAISEQAGFIEEPHREDWDSESTIKDDVPTSPRHNRQARHTTTTSSSRPPSPFISSQMQRCQMDTSTPPTSPTRSSSQVADHTMDLPFTTGLDLLVKKRVSSKVDENHVPIKKSRTIWGHAEGEMNEAPKD